MELKKLILGTFLVFTILAPASAVNLTEGLIAYYSLEESGAPYIDSTGNGHTGVSSDAPSQITGKIGFGQDFNTATQRINFSVLTDMRSGTDQAHTINYWIDLDTTPAIDFGMSYLVTTTLGDRATQHHHSTTPDSTWWNTCDDATVTIVSAPGASIPLNSFTMVTITWNDTGNGTIYVDGSQQDTDTSCGTLASQIAGDGLILGDPCCVPVFGAHDALDGVFDEIGIWNKQLTQSEITALYNSGDGVPFSGLSTAGVTEAVEGVNLPIGAVDGVDHTFTYNETSGFITFTWNDTASDTVQAGFFDTLLLDSSGETFLNRNITSDQNGTLRFNISSFLDPGESIKANAYIQDSNRTFSHGGDTALVDQLIIEEAEALVQEFDRRDAAVYTFIILITMITLGIISKSATATIALTLGGLLFSSFVFLNVSRTFLMIFSVLGLILMWVISKRRVG